MNGHAVLNFEFLLTVKMGGHNHYFMTKQDKELGKVRTGISRPATNGRILTVDK